MNRKILITAIVVLFLDQITKGLILAFFKEGETLPIIKNFLSLTYVENSGAAWGLFANNLILIIFITLIAALIIYKFMYSFQRNNRNNLAFGLVLGGLFGNLIDRIIFGYVRDFIDFNIFGYDYPVFNVSDIAIVIGIFLLIIAIFKGEDHNAVNSRKK